MANTVKSQSKSSRTRASILAAARKLFSRYGYEGASVRDIAADAGVDPALVIRYFGSKDGLFAETTEFDLKLPDPSGISRDELGAALTRHFLQLWESPESRGALVILLRTASSNEAATTKIRKIFEAQVVPMLKQVAEPDALPLRAGLISSHLLGIALCRYLLRLPPVVAMSPEQIVIHVGPVIQHYALGGLNET